VDEVTILRLAQYATACVAIISGAAVARKAVGDAGKDRWLSLLVGVVISAAFLYVAIELATRRIYT
jgi:hypothetical protein